MCSPAHINNNETCLSLPGLQINVRFPCELLTVDLVSFCKKLNMEAYDPGFLVLGIYPREKKTYAHTKICTKLFLIASSVIVPNWTEPKCP